MVNLGLERCAGKAKENDTRMSTFLMKNNPTTLTLDIFSAKIEHVISTSVLFSLCYI